MAGKSEFKALKSQNGRLRKKLEEAEKRIKELENSIIEIEETKKTEKKKIKVGNWNIVKSGGYYRAYQRIKGKVHGVYVGKKLNGARAKIDAWEAKFFVKQS
jgi:predicted  nucleic acid-binding Zn-ribbon protein